MNKLRDGIMKSRKGLNNMNAGVLCFRAMMLCWAVGVLSSQKHLAFPGVSKKDLKEKGGVIDWNVIDWKLQIILSQATCAFGANKNLIALPANKLFLKKKTNVSQNKSDIYLARL